MKTVEKNNFGKPLNFKKILTYPDSGKIRFQVSLDKNGQVYEIRRCFAQVIKNPETKKRFVKVTIGERPRLLFERIKGRPFPVATSWIDDFIQEIINENIEQEQ